MMKRSSAIAVLLAVVLLSSGCTTVQNRIGQAFDRNTEYVDDPFYARYLDPAVPLDAEIQRTLDALRADPYSPRLHNRMGALLVEKGFPKDAEVEFRRAIRADSRFFPAWYNLGLSRQAQGDDRGAMRAFRRTLAVKPGHAAAHFQLGLMLEERRRIDEALEHYVKAFRINEALLRVDVNPRILDSKIVDLALIRLYPSEHVERSLRFEPAPGDYVRPARRGPTGEPEAPSRVPRAEEIITPAPAVTDPPNEPTLEPDFED
jgi:tetratricopeptide (TPR) repeat protein